MPIPLNPDAPRTIPTRASWMRYTGSLASPWPAHTPTTLRAAGAIPVQTGRGGAWLLPYEDTEGYQIRYLDGGEPKVRNYGLRGPALVRRGDGPTIVVEGWADALPFEDHTVALLGTANWQRLDLRAGRAGWILALDNDGPGKLCRDSITRACLQMGVPVAWVVYEGKDPAAMVGTMSVKDIRGLRDMRCQ